MKEKIRSVLKSLKDHWKNADAQDLVEYALLLVLVGLAAVASVKTLGQRVSNVFVTTKAEMVQGTTVAGTIIGIGNDLAIANSSTAAADNAEAASIGALANSYAAASRAAFASGNVAAGVDLAAAAAADGGFIGAQALATAAARAAAAGNNGGFLGASGLAGAVNAAVNLANNLVAAAAATTGQ